MTITPEERVSDMLDRYGEVCTKTVAARVLGCSTGKIKSMLKDGRLDTACAGTMVDVRSIARYICEPAQEDFEARRRRYKQRRGSSWAV